jgi:hypothetical protein
MRETDYVELAFYAGWLDALGYAMPEAELERMRQLLREQTAQMIQDYVESVTAEAADA